MRCAVTSCGDRAVGMVTWPSCGSLALCGRHLWPWRAGRGNGTADVEFL